jgi:hypothetical protein
MSHRVFLVSPARCDGKRAALLFNERAEFGLARRLRQPAGAPLGEVFSFLSGLYFRGKLAYAEAFARPPRGVARTLIITTHRGLVSASTRVTLDDLRAFAEVPIDLAESRYLEPLLADARRLAGRIGGQGQAVLLGSVATPKYTQPLDEVFGARLHFPVEFAGRGDMSRGGLMLRAVDEGRELVYDPIGAGPRRGPRPLKLVPRPAATTSSSRCS